MGQLNFDQQGNLTPYDLIETDWDSFVETFGWNGHRQVLIDSFSTFLSDLDKLPIRTFSVWLDGSFVTRKDLPNDLDAVFIIPSKEYELFEKELGILRSQFGNLDVYFVKLIEEGEPNRFLYISDCTEWMFQFTTTRVDRVTKRKFPKGFLQLKQNNE
ncbi:DUF6932 family protein [uncultured Fibrella sp.]|uniref:DUF6932 family protein n=1 Tax=uncultured Fibrella sp. TaxID=1284596 RepID=UPI0035C98A02